MAQLYTSGPVGIFVASGRPQRESTGEIRSVEKRHNPSNRPTGIRFLGLTEKGPRIEIIPKFRNIQSDEEGDGVADVLWTSEEGLIFCDLNRWNEDVYAAVASRPVYYQQRGVTARRDVGTMMVRNQLTYGLYLHFTHWIFDSMGGPVRRSGVPVAQGGFGVFPTLPADVRKMPAGYYFPCAYLLGPDKFDPLGTRVRKIQLVFHALRFQTILSGSGHEKPSDPGLLYYTQNQYFTGLPPID
jgi:hypothetical protein